MSLLRLQGLRSMLSPVHQSEDRAGRHVFIPEGRISCLPRRKLRTSLRNFRRVLGTCCPWCCMGRRVSGSGLGMSRMRMAAAFVSPLMLWPAVVLFPG